MLVKTRLRTKRAGVEEQRAPDDSSYELDDSFLPVPLKD
jgi:hypothetical protein